MKKSEIKNIAKEIVSEIKNGTTTYDLFRNDEINTLYYNSKTAELKECVREIANSLKSMKTIYKVSVNSENIGIIKVCGRNEFDSVPVSISVFLKPCKEFTRLSSWLEKYGNQKLSEFEIRKEYLFGKRSRYDIQGTEYLMYKPKRCEEILKSLRNARSTKDKVNYKVSSEIYYGDRFNSYGEDMESEWYGENNVYGTIFIKTPTGRLKKEMNIFV